MVLPLLALAPYAGAGLAALGGAGRFFNSPMGQRTVQGGLNLVNRGVSSLQNYLNPVANMVNLGQTQGQPIQNLARMSVTSMPILDPAMNLADSLTQGSVGTAEAAEPSAADIEEMLEKDKKEEKESKKTKVKGKPVSVTKNDDGSITKIYADGSFEKFRDGELVAKGGVATASKKKKTKKEMMKKGGYVKKKRKRKPYKPSSFVKMKGRKRYI